MVRERFPWVTLVASEENLGYGAAVNLVAERTATPWIAPANEDIELTHGALEALIEAGEAHPEAGVVAPRLILPDGSTQHSVYPFPTVWFTALFNTGIPHLSSRLADRLCLEGHWDPERAREVPWAIATFMLVRREAFEGVGGFDSAQFMHSEDLDLAWRLTRAGWKARYEPRARIRHVGSAASKKAFGDQLMVRWMAATYSWMARQRGVVVAWTVAALNVAGAGARWALLTPLALLRPGRYRGARQSYRYWVGVHRTGLRRRSALLERH
jgi:GT2 family glycosyltransferase